MRAAPLVLGLVLALLTPRAHAQTALGARLPEGEPAAANAGQREFAVDDVARAQRLAIAVLQDLGFVLETADAAAGVLTASCADAHPLRLTVAIERVGEANVRASLTADYDGQPLASDAPAAAFFAAYAAALDPPVDF